MFRTLSLYIPPFKYKKAPPLSSKKIRAGLYEQSRYHLISSAIHITNLIKYGAIICSYTVVLITRTNSRRRLLLSFDKFRTQLKGHCSNEHSCFFSASEALWKEWFHSTFPFQRFSYIIRILRLKYRKIKL